MRYIGSGIFAIEVDSENRVDAQRKVERILRDSGIDGDVLEMSEVEASE